MSILSLSRTLPRLAGLTLSPVTLLLAADRAWRSRRALARLSPAQLRDAGLTRDTATASLRRL